MMTKLILSKGALFILMSNLCCSRILQTISYPTERKYSGRILQKVHWNIQTQDILHQLLTWYHYALDCFSNRSTRNNQMHVLQMRFLHILHLFQSELQQIGIPSAVLLVGNQEQCMVYHLGKIRKKSICVHQHCGMSILDTTWKHVSEIRNIFLKWFEQN